MAFEIVGKIEDIETIASGKGIRELKRLSKAYGKGHWLKRKGRAKIKIAAQETRIAELHWYEAHGLGKREFKIKRFLTEK
jgi:hypothetical protein